MGAEDYNNQSEWIYMYLFHHLGDFYEKYGLGSGNILYTALIMDEEFMKHTPQIKKLQHHSIDPYTLFTLVNGNKLSDKVKTNRINALWKVLGEHCPLEDCMLDLDEVPNFKEIDFKRTITVADRVHLKRTMDQQHNVWKTLGTLLACDVPYCAFSKEMFERSYGCTFNDFTIFLHGAVDEYFIPLDKWHKKIWKIKKVTYKSYADVIGVSERNVEIPTLKYHEEKYVIL